MWSSASKPLVVRKNHEENGDRIPLPIPGEDILRVASKVSKICGKVCRCNNTSFANADCEDFGVTECFLGGILKRVLAFQLAFGDMEQDKRKKSTSSFVGGDAAKVPKWAQKTVTLPAAKRGCHLVTPTILKDVEADLAHFQCGLAHFFLQHTSASLTINENYDSDVLDDVETWLTGTVPEGRKAPWKHTIEGPDDMPAHIKSSVFGCALSIPITDGRLNLGTWQGIWLCEHRDHASARKVVITMTGV